MGFSLTVSEAPGLLLSPAFYSPMEQAWENWSLETVITETVACYRWLS